MARTQPRAIPSIQQVLPTSIELVPLSLVQGVLRAATGRFLERVFSPMIAVWCFAFQRLNADHTLDAVISHVASGAVDLLDERDRLPVFARPQSQSTAVYSKARKRLPLTVLQRVAQHFVQAAEHALGDGARWHGYPVAMLDGTTTTLRPEEDLVQHYGQAGNQRGPCNWVVMRVVAAFSLHTAALLAEAEGHHLQSEQSLPKTVLAQLPPHSVLALDGLQA